jgi:hypothetical protein
VLATNVLQSNSYFQEFPLPKDGFAELIRRIPSRDRCRRPMQGSLTAAIASTSDLGSIRIPGWPTSIQARKSLCKWIYYPNAILV